MRLAAAVRPDEGDAFAGADRQVDVAEDGVRAVVAEPDAAHLEDRQRPERPIGTRGVASRGAARLGSAPAVLGQPDAGLRHALRRALEDGGRRPDVDRSSVVVEREDDIRERPRELGPMLDQDDRRGRAARGAPRGSAKIAAVPAGSRCAVGSSRTSTPGPRREDARRARPVAARRPRAGWSGAPRTPRGPTLASASGTRARIASRGHAEFSSPKATSSPTRSMTSWLAGSWSTIAGAEAGRRDGRGDVDRARLLGAIGSFRATSMSPTRSEPCHVPGNCARQQAGDRAGERALARAGRTDDQQHGPRLDLELEVSERRPRAPGVGECRARRPDRPGRRGLLGAPLRPANPSSTPARRSDRSSSTRAAAPRTRSPRSP